MGPLCFIFFSQLSLSSASTNYRTNVNDDAITKRPNETKEFCLSGQFLDAEVNECKPCPVGHYMPNLVHSQLRCYPCEEVTDNSREVIWAPCTMTQATTIGCKKGYFLRLAAVSDKKLVKCYQCSACSPMNPPSFEIRSCGKLFDTLCCPQPHMTAVKRDGESGYECRDPNFGKVSQTPISSQSPKFIHMLKSAYLGYNSIYNPLFYESKETSSSISTPALESVTLHNTANKDCPDNNVGLKLSLGLLIALSIMCSIFMIYRLYREKNCKRRHTMKPRPGMGRGHRDYYWPATSSDDVTGLGQRFRPQASV